MKKLILMVLFVFFVDGCSQKKPEPKKIAKKKIVKNEIIKNKIIKKPLKSSTKISTLTPLKIPVIEAEEEFIPEHIRRSSIEVVKHY